MVQAERHARQIGGCGSLAPRLGGQAGQSEYRREKMIMWGIRLTRGLFNVRMGVVGFALYLRFDLWGVVIDHRSRYYLCGPFEVCKLVEDY